MMLNVNLPLIVAFLMRNNASGLLTLLEAKGEPMMLIVKVLSSLEM